MADDLFNLQGTVGANTKQLDSDLARAETKAKTAAGNMDKLLGAVRIGAVIQGTSAGMDALTAGLKAARGDAEGFQTVLEKLPFGLGRVASSTRELVDELNGMSDALKEVEEWKVRSARSDKSEEISQSVIDAIRLEGGTETDRFAAKIDKQIEAAKQRRAQAFRDDPDQLFSNAAEKAGEEIKALQRYRAQRLLELDTKAGDEWRKEQSKALEERNMYLSKVDREHSQIQMDALNEWEEDIVGQDAQALRRDIEDQRILNEANEAFFGEGQQAGGAREFNALMFAGGNVGGNEREQPKAKQIDKTNALLSEIARKVGQQAAINVVAQ